MTDTENAFAAAQYEPIPAAARDFVKKAAATAKERATTFHAGADKATTAVEQTVVTAVGEVAKLTRQAQQAAYEDAQAFFLGRRPVGFGQVRRRSDSDLRRLHAQPQRRRNGAGPHREGPIQQTRRQRRQHQTEDDRQ